MRKRHSLWMAALRASWKRLRSFFFRVRSFSISTAFVFLFECVRPDVLMSSAVAECSGAVVAKFGIFLVRQVFPMQKVCLQCFRGGSQCFRRAKGDGKCRRVCDETGRHVGAESSMKS